MLPHTPLAEMEVHVNNTGAEHVGPPMTNCNHKRRNHHVPEFNQGTSFQSLPTQDKAAAVAVTSLKTQRHVQLTIAGIQTEAAAKSAHKTSATQAAPLPCSSNASTATKAPGVTNDAASQFYEAARVSPDIQSAEDRKEGKTNAAPAAKPAIAAQAEKVLSYHSTAALHESETTFLTAFADLSSPNQTFVTALPYSEICAGDHQTKPRALLTARLAHNPYFPKLWPPYDCATLSSNFDSCSYQTDIPCSNSWEALLDERARPQVPKDKTADADQIQCSETDDDWHVHMKPKRHRHTVQRPAAQVAQQLQLHCVRCQRPWKLTTNNATWFLKHSMQIPKRCEGCRTDLRMGKLRRTPSEVSEVKIIHHKHQTPKSWKQIRLPQNLPLMNQESVPHDIVASKENTLTPSSKSSDPSSVSITPPRASFWSRCSTHSETSTTPPVVSVPGYWHDSDLALEDYDTPAQQEQLLSGHQSPFLLGDTW